MGEYDHEESKRLIAEGKNGHGLPSVDLAIALASQLQAAGEEIERLRAVAGVWSEKQWRADFEIIKSERDTARSEVARLTAEVERLREKVKDLKQCLDVAEEQIQALGDANDLAVEVERLKNALRSEFEVGAEYQRLRAVAEADLRIAKTVADDALAEVERLTKALKDQTFETYLECSAQQVLYEEIQRLRTENTALTSVYTAAARMRTFPVPFDDHWALVGAVDACRPALHEDEDDTAVDQ